MKTLKVNFKFWIFSALVLPALVAGGCGASSYRDGVDGIGDGSSIPDDGSDGDDDGGGGTGGIGIDPHEFTYTFKGTSTGGIPSPSAWTTQTDDILKVKVTPGDGTIMLTGSVSGNPSPTSYGCAQVTVDVNGSTKTSPVMRVGDGYANVYHCLANGYCYQQYENCCPNAPESAVLDFSGWIQQRGDTSIKIKITGVKYPRVQGCTPQPTFWNNTTKTAHKVSAQIFVQTNQTDPFTKANSSPSF